MFSIGFGAESDDSLNYSLILESANHNENTFSNDNLISVLTGNVVFSYNDISIKSDKATWWRNDGIIRFQDSILVTRGAQILECDNMTFTEKNNMLTASGNFHCIDTLEKTELSGKSARYNVETRQFHLTGNPLLTRIDTVANDTLSISGTKMTYIDSTRCAIITGDVKIIKGELSSSSKFASYFTKDDYATLRNEPVINYQSHKIVGDSIDLTFGNKTLKSASVAGNSHGIYTDISKIRKDTTYTHIWGDSLYLSVSDSGDLDSIWAFGKAICKNISPNEPDRINEASGKTMLLSFAKNNDVENIKIWGNAKSKYYIEENNNKGTNEASGDSITVHFKRGKASQLTLNGSARGVYFPQNL